MVVFFVYELPAISEIDYEDFVSSFAQPSKEIFRIDIVIDQILLMYPLDSVNELTRYEQSRLEAELSITKPQQMLKRRPIHISDKGAIIMLDSKPIQVWYSCASLDQSVDFGFLFQFRGCGQLADWLNLYRYLLFVC